jgi:hypothetical protein
MFLAFALDDLGGDDAVRAWDRATYPAVTSNAGSAVRRTRPGLDTVGCTQGSAVTRSTVPGSADAHAAVARVSAAARVALRGQRQREATDVTEHFPLHGVRAVCTVHCRRELL